MRNIEIEWDENSVDHIWSHHVEPEEVEESLRGRYVLRKGAHGSYYVYGQSYGGRYLFIVLGKKSSGHFRVVTTRDMNDAERRRFAKQIR